jgi:hypothetical protein
MGTVFNDVYLPRRVRVMRRKKVTKCAIFFLSYATNVAQAKRRRKECFWYLVVVLVLQPQHLCAFGRNIIKVGRKNVPCFVSA